jgi:hypothetical protein
MWAKLQNVIVAAVNVESCERSIGNARRFFGVIAIVAVRRHGAIAGGLFRII